MYGLYAQQLLGSESQNQWFKRPYASLCLLAGVEEGAGGGGEVSAPRAEAVAWEAPRQASYLFPPPPDSAPSSLSAAGCPGAITQPLWAMNVHL